MDGYEKTFSLSFNVKVDERRAASMSDSTGYKIDRYQYSWNNNIITGHSDGGVSIKILEAYDIN